MKLFNFLLFLLFSNFLLAQVGVGNTNPDASSILDITSTTKGMLAPRMTTLQREAITTPADGLLVYDTDESSFYFYKASNWVIINSDLQNVERDNYKLVKSAADLADELVAGGGTTYELDTNTYYEINGTVVLSFPIDLNNAYISGLDANEDVLFQPTGTIFSGTTGGSIRNLTLVSSASKIFDITAAATETLVFQNSIIANSAEVGDLEGFGVVFCNIINIVNNSDGIVFTDIDNLLLSNLAWFESNSGTFETYIGNFDLIEKISGFFKVPAGATGIDVSNNPSVGFGSIVGTPFSGLGTFIDGYTVGSYSGYDFSNDWNINSPGIRIENDNSASADFYYTGAVTTGFTQTITNGTAQNIEGGGTFSGNNLFRFTAPAPGNRLTYDGIEQRQFQVNASLSIRVLSATSDFYGFLIAKNGTVITESNSVIFIDSDSQIQNVAINAIANLEKGDYIEVFVQRLTGTGSDTLVVFSENLSIN
ncbi:cell wall anchor protein [Winogradskyella sp. PE311]|uniref:cell wall anchor protein n=1 Tax=Winogradskyella sp. PE311 TaxID=3366943 RepID=UPI0039818605